MPSPDGSLGKQRKKQKIKAASKSNTERHRGILSTETSCLAENCRMLFKAALKKTYPESLGRVTIMCNKKLNCEAKTLSCISTCISLFLWLQPHRCEELQSLVKS